MESQVLPRAKIDFFTAPAKTIVLFRFRPAGFCEEVWTESLPVQRTSKKIRKKTGLSPGRKGNCLAAFGI
jgi:hypothetical protein